MRASGICALLLSGAAQAATPQQAASLDGKDLTCMGAMRAGSAAGVAPYTGKWSETWPGLKNAQGYDPGPYAAEKPLFTITAANAAQYAAHLTEGQQALLKKFPAAFRMPVYASHRDFRYADWVCDTVRQNALDAALEPGGLGARQALGAIPFPFPANGLEALFDIKRGAGPWSEEVVHSTADVYANGTIAWGKVGLKVLVPWNKPELKPRPRTPPESIEAYFLHEQFLPERDKGTVSVGTTPLDYGHGALTAYVYLPGTRRVRQAVDVPPDYPAPPDGFHTVDDEALFNGSPERFSWKLLGRREVYVPYDNFGLNDPSLRYKDLIGAQTLNPEHLRYELHRVWVVEGTLKPGLRHVYSKRVLYADEDSWHPLWADMTDAHGALWRAAFSNHFWSPAARSFHRGVTVYHDLIAGNYEAEYLVNESGAQAWRFNNPALTPAQFSSAALARRGH